MSVSYVPGTWVAVAGLNAWLLMDVSSSDPRIARCWELLSDEAGSDAVLDVLVAGGVRAMPDFALVQLENGSGRAVVRGMAYVVVPGSADITADARQPWSEVSIAGVGVELTGGTVEPAPSLPLAAGVTMAASVRIGTRETVLAPAFPSGGSVQASLVSTEMPVSTVAADLGTEDSEPESPGYDHLFGATQRPAEISAVEASDSPPPDVEWGATAGWDGEQAPASEPVSGRFENTLIDGLPWEISQPPKDANRVAPVVRPRPFPAGKSSGLAPQPPAAPAVEHTVLRSKLQPFTDVGGVDAATVGATVLAGFCPRGHPSALHSPTCRICESPMPDQEGVVVPRPSLGSLRLSTGDVVTLDRGVLLGRAPEVPDGLMETPHVVRLQSPENDISRTHAEIELDGWNVYIRDLNSTNGTVVILPGQRPLRLGPHDALLLENRSEVRLADEVSFVFEVTG